jgi:3-dehydroquinate dehydratase type I
MKIKKMGADIIKIAVQANSWGDNLIVLDFLDKNSKNEKIIALCMGEKGKITRIVGHLFGNYLVYAPMVKQKETAKGQIDFLTLKQIRCLLK